MSVSADTTTRRGAEANGGTPALAFLCHPYHRGGVTRWMVDAAAEWRARGGASWFVTPKPRAAFRSGGRRPTMVALVESCDADVRPTLVAPLAGQEFEFGTAAYRTSVYAAAAREVPAGVPLVVSDDPSVWAAAASLATRNPFIGVLHSDDEPYYALARAYAGVAAALVCVSGRVERRARKVVGGEAGKVATIPCGVPLRPLAAAPPEAAVRARLAWVGRVEEHQKRVLDLPRIAAGLRDAELDFELTVVGDGPEVAALGDAVRAAGLADRVTFAGWQPTERVWSLLTASDVMLLPSNFEGMPVSAMEALSAGCAVVASRVSGIEDYERHAFAAECLRVHQIGDIAEAAAGVLGLLAQPESDRRRHARALAEAEFSIGACMDRYETLIEALPRQAESSTPSRAMGDIWTRLVSYPVAAARAVRVRLGERRPETGTVT
ncbi:MAG: glycosyltransferase family 4 protein [Gemmatimonadaceae bacterium]